MRTIYKYPLELGASTITFEVPQGGKVLCVQTQNNMPCVWIDLPDTRAELKYRCFAVFGTGQPMPNINMTYIGTVQTHDGRFVWHVYECH